MKHNEMIKKWMENPEFRDEYNALEEEFAFIKELLRARESMGLTQKEVAERMGTRLSVVSRLEASSGKNQYSPSIAILRKYAEALGCRLEIKLIPH